MTSVRRELTLRPLKPVLERASGMRIFEGDEIVDALTERGFTGDPPAARRAWFSSSAAASQKAERRLIGKTSTVTSPAAMKPAEVAASIRPRSTGRSGSRRR